MVTICALIRAGEGMRELRGGGFSCASIARVLDDTEAIIDFVRH